MDGWLLEPGPSGRRRRSRGAGARRGGRMSRSGRVAPASPPRSRAEACRARERLLAVVHCFLRDARLRLRVFLIARLRQEFTLAEDQALALVSGLEDERVIEAVRI